MSFKSSAVQYCSGLILLISLVISLVGLNETIIGYITFVNRNYGALYGGEYVVVSTSNGLLKGFHNDNWMSRDQRPFYEFLGVPFARPPVGNLRFQPPVKVAPWTGIRDATGYGSKCWQFDPFIEVLSGEEDCLYLNVFTPKLNVSKEDKLPVIVFIHGGLFMFGRAEMFRPEYIMDEDVVLVQIHYRLGAFGFLNVNEEIRGNMGLKDQVLALQWVQENIENFGGDRNKVTLLGESAGGSSIHLHMLSPLSKGLFQKAITMSGTALNNWAFNPKPEEQAQLVGSRLGCPTNNTGALAKCLKTLDAFVIAQLFREIMDFLHPRLMVFAPTIEHIRDETSFLSDNPRKLVKTGQIPTKVPWMTGINSDEGLIYGVGILLNSTCTSQLNTNWNHWAPLLFDYEDFDAAKRNSVSQQILQYYMNGSDFSLTSLQSVVHMFSDASFYRAVEETATIHSHSTAHESESPLFLYYFSYQSRNAIAQVYLNMVGHLPVAMDGILTNGIRWFKTEVLGLEEVHYGACHADELSMLFQYPRVLGVVDKYSRDYEFSKQLIKIWVSFVKTGKPMLDSEVEWPPVRANSGQLQYMELNRDLKLITQPFTKRLQFWRNLNIDNEPIKINCNRTSLCHL